jgi:hypothetical protein
MTPIEILATISGGHWKLTVAATDQLIVQVSLLVEEDDERVCDLVTELAISDITVGTLYAVSRAEVKALFSALSLLDSTRSISGVYLNGQPQVSWEASSEEDFDVVCNSITRPFKFYR